MAQTFHPITPVDVSPTTAGAWTDVDVSSYVPSGATGVILHDVQNTLGFSDNLGFRKNGSTDDRHPNISASSHQWVAIGVDSNRVFEAYVGNLARNEVYLVGYTTSGVTFFTNAYDKSLTATGSWLDIDCSTEAPNAVGLIFEGYAGTGYDIGFRKNGGSDNRTNQNYRRIWAVIGCDDAQICEGYISNLAYDFFLIGYVTDGATFNTNATDLSLGTTGSWLDLPALPSTAVMGFIEVVSSVASNYGLRKNGSSEDIYYRPLFHYWADVECDAARIIEGKIADTGIDFFLIGYATAVVTKTSSDSGSGLEGAPVSTATLTGSESGQGLGAISSQLAAIMAAEVGTSVELGALLKELLASELGRGSDSFVAKIEAPTRGGGMKLWT